MNACSRRRPPDYAKTPWAEIIAGVNARVRFNAVVETGVAGSVRGAGDCAGNRERRSPAYPIRTPGGPPSRCCACHAWTRLVRSPDMKLDTAKARAEAEGRLAEAQRIYTETIRALQVLERNLSEKQSRKKTAKKPQGFLFAPEVRPSLGGAGSVTQDASEGIRGAILGYINAHPKGATFAHILDFVLRDFPGQATKRQVARVLYKMNKRGHIRMLRKQSGPVPGLYGPAPANRGMTTTEGA